MKVRQTENAAVDGALVEVWGQSDLEVLTDGVALKDESSDSFLWDLYEQGALEPPIDPFLPVDPYQLILEGQETVDPRAVKALAGMEITPRRDPVVDFDMLAMTAEVMQYVDNAKTWEVANFNYLPYELARFVVPNNQVGIVRTIETDLTFDDVTLDFPERGDCIYWERLEAYFVWMLRVEHLDPKAPPNPYGYRGPLIPPDVQIPGTPYGNLPQWREMRFQWGKFNPVYIIIPENTLLSLWIVFENGSCNVPLRSVSGRFTGFRQSQASWKAYHNLTTAW
jgi:hypothetical protein